MFDNNIINAYETHFFDLRLWFCNLIQVILSLTLTSFTNKEV